jgi:hypothetical protein
MFNFRGALPLLTAAALILPADTAFVQTPERESEVIVYGDDPCPASTSDTDVVVCARRPEEERYRIPAPLRRSSRPPETSWSSRSEALEDAQRDGRPDSCSVVGTFGQTGCRQEMLRDWAAERRARRRNR